MQLIRPYGALYIHIPFCAKRCLYCDFCTEALAADDQKIDDYVDGLVRDIRHASREGLLAEIKTVYIGGGTPTFIGHKRLVNLVYTLSLSMNIGEELEFSIEANPESLSLAMVRDLYSLGVNRLSLGVQSFADAELRALGRIHNVATARSAIETARQRFENVSLDLMCGIPLQTPESWQKSLQAAVQSGVTHISVYPLTIEEGSAFARSAMRGELEMPDEDLQAELMQMAADHLGREGFGRYEVASYAREGMECLHNIAYWTGVPYLGLGRGGAGMRETAQGRERLLDGQVVEELSAEEAAIEDLMLGMRMSRGIGEGQVIKATAHRPQIIATFSELQGLGLVENSQGRWRPTERGWLLGNELYGRILNA